MREQTAHSPLRLLRIPVEKLAHSKPAPTQKKRPRKIKKKAPR
jgi:hypothetical protein